MDLNQNNRNYERDVLAERVNRIERFLESFDLELVEPVEGANKIRVNKFGRLTVGYNKLGGGKLI
jgi:hypothetical protein